jgi:lipoprotein-anchoring transpeptidase ErfK/SrfK
VTDFFNFFSYNEKTMKKALLTGTVLIAAAVAILAPSTGSSASGDGTVLSERNGISRWAHVLRPVAARSAPSASARTINVVSDTTPEGTNNLVLALESKGPWVRVRLAVLPNGTTGWVPRTALGPYRGVWTHLVVNRARRTATLRRRGKVIFRAPVGVGRSYLPTPRGEFYVRMKLAGFEDPMYGPIAFGTSGRAPNLTGWPGGGYIGIHGTDKPQLLPGAVSHGCIRMKNPDILRLARLMPVGTPVTVL